MTMEMEIYKIKIEFCVIELGFSFVNYLMGSL
jgi:hypothetical protein